MVKGFQQSTKSSALRRERRKASWRIPRLGRVINEKTQRFLDARIRFVSRGLLKVLAKYVVSSVQT